MKKNQKEDSNRILYIFKSTKSKHSDVKTITEKLKGSIQDFKFEFLEIYFKKVLDKKVTYTDSQKKDILCDRIFHTLSMAFIEKQTLFSTTIDIIEEENYWENLNFLLEVHYSSKPIELPDILSELKMKKKKYKDFIDSEIKYYNIYFIKSSNFIQDLKFYKEKLPIETFIVLFKPNFKKLYLVTKRDCIEIQRKENEKALTDPNLSVIPYVKEILKEFSNETQKMMKEMMETFLIKLKEEIPKESLKSTKKNDETCSITLENIEIRTIKEIDEFCSNHGLEKKRKKERKDDLVKRVKIYLKNEEIKKNIETTKKSSKRKRITFDSDSDNE